MRDFQAGGRSTVHALNGMAATSHPLATLAAVDMLRAGGTAADAAVTAAALLGVVEPHATGIGGDAFALYSPGGGENVIAYNGSGAAPLKASADWYLQRGIKAIPLTGPHAVTVPGAVDLWATLSGAARPQRARRGAAAGHPRRRRWVCGRAAGGVGLGAQPRKIAQRREHRQRIFFSTARRRR